MPKPRLTTDQIHTALQPEYGNIDLHQLVEGEESQAFTFTHQETQFVVRVNPTADGFAKDAWAHRTLGHVIPIPEVHHIGPIAGHHYCVTTRLPGDTIQNTTDPDRLKTLAPAITAVADHIAATDLTDTTGYGNLDPATRAGAHTTWADTILAIADIDLGEHHHLRPTVTRLHDAITQVAPHLPHTRRLVHGDYGANNLLTDGEKITGVLDWETAMIGDPHYDTANTRFWAPFLPCMRVQSEHDAQRLTDQTTRDAVRCYLTAIGLHAVGYYLADGRVDVAHAMLERTESAL